MTASISLRGVSQRFGVTWTLTDIDLDLVPGATGLLGPNGAGKTTLLRPFASALASTQGRVSVLGLDPMVPAQRTGIRRLGYLPQEIGFPRGFSAFTFANYVAMKEWAQPAGRHAEVRRVLGQVGLCGDPAKRIRAMSGGPRGCGSWPCRSCCWPDASRLGRTSLDRPDTSFPPISSLYAVRCHGRPGITGETP